MFFKSLFLLILSTSYLYANEFAVDPNDEEKEIQVKEEKLASPGELNKSKKAIWLAHILRDRGSKNKIQNLLVSPYQVPVFLVPSEKSFKPLVKLQFRYNRPGWGLYDIYGKSLSKGEAKDSQYVYAYLKSRISTIDILAVSPDNQTEKERIYLFAPEAREFTTVSIFDSVLFSLGHAYLEYKQSSSGFTKYTSQSLLLGARYLSPEKGKRIGYFGEFFTTVHTYESSPIDRSSNFLEARVGATYSAKVFKNPRSRSRVTFGLNTINLYSLGGGLGFSGLFGPNIGLRTEYYKSSRDSIATELQYTNYEIAKPFSERSIKVSVDYNRALKNLRKAQIGFSFSSNEFSEGLEEISANLLSVYFSLSF